MTTRFIQPRAVRDRLAELVQLVWRDVRVRRVLWVLLAVDVILIGWYAVTRALRALEFELGAAGHPVLRITTDRGIPEFLGYGKALVAAALCGRLAARSGQPVYAVLAAIFGAILLDDALDVHERIGALLFGGEEASFGAFSGQDLGELVAWALIALTVSALVAWGWVRSLPADRTTGAALLVPVLAVAFCAVGIDALYGPFGHAFPASGLLLDTMEDGGEMIAMTAAVALTLAAWRHGADGGS